MSNNKHNQNKKNNKKQDGKFDSKNVKHDPQAESARDVFGLKQQPEQKR